MMLHGMACALLAWALMVSDGGGPVASSAAAAATLLAASSGAPSTAPSTIVLTPKGEPGEPLEVAGVVYDADGRTPVAGVRILVYHTDKDGLYSKKGQDRQRATFSGRMVTGADGRYRFLTILPGHYPGGQTPRHIHFVLESKDGRHVNTELRFADDPALGSEERARAAAQEGDRFHMVRPVTKDAEGVRHCTFDIRFTD